MREGGRERDGKKRRGTVKGRERERERERRRQKKESKNTGESGTGIRSHSRRSGTSDFD